MLLWRFEALPRGGVNPAFRVLASFHLLSLNPLAAAQSHRILAASPNRAICRGQQGESLLAGGIFGFHWVVGIGHLVAPPENHSNSGQIAGNSRF